MTCNSRSLPAARSSGLAFSASSAGGMSEATRKFAAIECAELAGKVGVNDFRFGSQD
jgi:hypothetical protein